MSETGRITEVCFPAGAAQRCEATWRDAPRRAGAEKSAPRICARPPSKSRPESTKLLAKIVPARARLAAVDRRILRRVVRCFLRDRNVMGMTLPYTCGRDLNES